MKILSIFGTRPETIKMAPVIAALKQEYGDDDIKTCITAQHRQMIDPLLEYFKIIPDFDLNVMRQNQTLTDLSCDILQHMEEVFGLFKPDRVLVQGDTTSSAMGALAAYYEKIPVTHIEAGLRSYNRYAPYPEEINRKIISNIADMHCAPTDLAAYVLRKEGILEDEIIVTGNTIIDVLIDIVQRLESGQLLRRHCEQMFDYLNPNKKLILVTGHRRENFGKPFAEICYALAELAKKDHLEIIYPVHFNPNVREPVNEILGDVKGIHIVEPVAYFEFVYLMMRAHIILSDSGGVQEEAPAINTPVLVMRDVTERPEAVDAGASKLVGTNRQSIVEGVELLLNKPHVYQRMVDANSPYGDGCAAQRIVAAIKARSECC